MNQDGRTTGLSLPSADSQRALLEQVYGNFSVDPSDLAFVEAHGTGTPVGDPIEADALGKGLAQRRSQPLPIGSVKSNIGHLEPVSGLAGVAEDHRGAEPARGAGDAAPAVAQSRHPVRRAQPAGGRPQLALARPARRRACRRQFLRLRRNECARHTARRRNDRARCRARGGRPPPLLLSAHSGDALPALAEAYVEHWPADKRVVNEFISASAHQRDALPHRLIVRGGTGEELRDAPWRFAEGEKSPAILTGAAVGSNLPVAFLFSGNGAQWAGMGATAWHTNAQFREALQEIDGHFAKMPRLVARRPAVRRRPRGQAAAGNLRAAAAARPAGRDGARPRGSRGVARRRSLGHSVGEIAAAWAAGISASSRPSTS